MARSICDEKPGFMQKDVPRGFEDGVARTACLILSRVVLQYLETLGEGTEKYDETLVLRWGCTDNRSCATITCTTPTRRRGELLLPRAGACHHRTLAGLPFPPAGPLAPRYASVRIPLAASPQQPSSSLSASPLLLSLTKAAPPSVHAAAVPTCNGHWLRRQTLYYI